MLDWTPVERVLLNLVIASTVLPLLVIGVAWFRRPGNAASRAFLWQSIFPAVLLAAIAGMSPIGLKLPVQSLSPLEPDNLALTDGLSKRYSQRNADVTLPAAVSKASVDASLNHRTNARVSDNQLAVPAAKAKSESMNRPASWPANLSTLDWSMIATAIWMLGMLWLLVRLMNGIRMARLIRRQAAPAPVSLQQLSCDVTLLLSDDMNSPAVIGFIRPAILMPTEATNWTSEELRMAIEHERAHVMRYDLQWQLVGQLTLAATWFQPLMWWVLRRYQRERELACDDAVLLRGHQPIRFAEMLARRSCDWPQQLIPSATIGMAEPPLKARLRSILSDTLERDCQLNVTAKRFAVAMILITVISGLLRPATLVAQTPTNSQADDILAELPSKTTGMAAVQGGEGTLTVTVVDQRGLPVAGVRPIPIQWVGRYRHTGMAQLTDDAGVTMITRLPTKRQLTVFLKKDGYAMGALSLRFAKPTARRLTCILDRPAKGWIDLRDPNGKPVQDAKLHAVRYVDSNGASQYLGAELCELLGLELATSDSVGRLMLPELPVQSNLQIHVSHPRWRSLTLHDQLAADGLLTSATMLPGVPVTIKIRGGDDASSVPDGTLVKVQLTGDERDARIVDQFEVRDGQIQLMAWDVNYQQLALQSKDFLIGPVKISMPFWPLQELDMTESSEREIEMTSWKKVRLTGRVVDQNGVGIAGVDVSACSGPTDLAKEMSTLMQKNASFVNQFRLMNRITPPDFARTNQRGEYRLEVGQAAAFVTAEKEGFRCDVDFVRVPIDGSASVEVEPIVLRKIQTLSGKVVDQQGRPVSGSLVWLLGQRQGRRKVVQTDGLGQFRLSVPSVPANVDQDQTSYLMAMNPFGRDAGLINVDLTNSVGSESLQVVVEPKSSEWLLDPTGRAEKNRGQESELLAAWQKELDHRRAAHPDGLPGNQAPELEGGTWLNTSETKLTDFRGRFVLLDFWYIGCGPCHIEIPELRIAHRSFPSERFSVVGVHTNHQSSASVQSFIEETGIEYPVVVDNRLGEISDAYASLGIASYPSYLLLDPNGKIVLNSSIADGNLRSQKLELIRNAIQAWDWE